jgi:hypothetical protein
LFVVFFFFTCRETHTTQHVAECSVLPEALLKDVQGQVVIKEQNQQVKKNSLKNKDYISSICFTMRGSDTGTCNEVLLVLKKINLGICIALLGGSRR